MPPASNGASILRPGRQRSDRTARHADGIAGEGLDAVLCLGRVVHPFAVEVERALRDAVLAVARGMHPGVAAVQQFEQMVLRLVVCPCVPDRGDRQLRVLDAVFLLAGLAERAAVEPDERRMTEIRIDAVESGRV